MSNQISKLLSVAREELGTKESPAGSNTVKYNTEYYGRAVKGADYPWCMAFVWWCFKEAGLSPMFYGGKKTASCATLLDYAKKNGQFVEPCDLRQGDVVLFKFSTNARAANHVGIVRFAYADSDVIVAYEGNTSVTSDDNGGAVMERTRNYKQIVGGYRPKYEEDEMATIVKTLALKSGKTEEQVIAGLTVLLKHVNLTEKAWEKDGAAYLLNEGLITTPRAGNEPVEFGEFGVILRNLIERHGKG